MFPIKVLPAAKILSPSNSTSDERMIAVFSCGLTFPQSLRSPAVYRAIRPDCWRLFFREPLFLNHFRSPAGLQGRSEPTAGIIFRGRTFPQSLRSPAGLRGRSNSTASIIFPGTTFPQSLRSPAGLRGRSDPTAGNYFSGTHCSPITSLSSRKTVECRSQGDTETLAAPKKDGAGLWFPPLAS